MALARPRKGFPDSSLPTWAVLLFGDTTGEYDPNASLSISVSLGPAHATRRACGPVGLMLPWSEKGFRSLSGWGYWERVAGFCGLHAALPVVALVCSATRDAWRYFVCKQVGKKSAREWTMISWISFLSSKAHRDRERERGSLALFRGCIAILFDTGRAQ